MRMRKKRHGNERLEALGALFVKEEGEVAVRCPNIQCPAQLIRNLIHFASRSAMDIDGLGKAMVEQLVKQDLIHSPADLY